MLDEIKTLEPQLKQIVYGCVEHVQATKAALYLSASHDLNDKTYVMITGYQFNDPLRKTLKSTDDLVDRLVVKRNAFFVNGLGTDKRFGEMLFRQGTDRSRTATWKRPGASPTRSCSSSARGNSSDWRPSRSRRPNRSSTRRHLP